MCIHMFYLCASLEGQICITLKGNVPQSTFFLKSGHHGATDLRNNKDLHFFLFYG